MSRHSSCLRREWERERHIPHAVLRHLHETGPMNWSGTDRFDRGATGEIGAILKISAQFNITEAGREWL
ncbi:MAG TPA: hypothetical protein VN657_08155 [Nitrospiraceae bacterium]|jgi:hypothetical protein|nr:hypothetical protein [Nitrospiraceae bacterium]